MKFPFPFSKCFSLPSETTQEQYPEIPEAIQSVHLYSYNELKAATRDFHFSNKIGEGGFGSVYKGQLKDGSIVAVKVLSVESNQGEKEFKSEISALSNIRHQNLVTLHGGCIAGTHRILVYEYMENNSLAQTLLGGKQNRIEFNWRVRREISLGVARGLAYLHEEIKPRIVHRDIKASNILLDSNFNPKVSDFGLSRLFTDSNSYISTRVAGTLGYLAPEYAISGHVTRKSDAYSFGVLLLEILSGRSVIDFDIEVGEFYLVEMAWEMYRNNKLVQLMDPTLKGNFPEEEAVRFLKVGLLCVQEIPRLRPQMSTAVKMMMMCDKMDISDVQISQPGCITNFSGLKTNPDSTSQSSSFTTRGSTSTSK